MTCVVGCVALAVVVVASASAVAAPPVSGGSAAQRQLAGEILAGMTPTSVTSVVIGRPMSGGRYCPASPVVLHVAAQAKLPLFAQWDVWLLEGAFADLSH
ncbi:MAG: hypothetical protein ACRD6W_05020, partial [Nitrososphaerales archaeon]